MTRSLRKAHGRIWAILTLALYILLAAAFAVRRETLP